MLVTQLLAMCYTSSGQFAVVVPLNAPLDVVMFRSITSPNCYISLGSETVHCDVCVCCVCVCDVCVCVMCVCDVCMYVCV